MNGVVVLDALMDGLFVVDLAMLMVTLTVGVELCDTLPVVEGDSDFELDTDGDVDAVTEGVRV